MSSISVVYNDESDMIEATIRGRVDMPTLEALRVQTLQLAAVHHCFRVLADLRGVEPVVSTVDIFRQPQRTEDALEAIGVPKSEFWRAFVVDDTGGDVQFFEDVAVNRGHTVKLFRNVSDAIDWLRTKPVKGPTD